MPKTPRTSFELAYQKLALPLTKFLVKRLGGDQEAVDEVFSRTIEAAWKGWHAFEHKSTYFTWICRIGLNKIADYYRHQVNRESVILAPVLENLAQLGVTNPAPEEKIALEELSSAVRSCINLLPPDARKLIYLRYWQKLSLKDIGRIFGLTPRSVEGRLYRAKKLLKNRLLAFLPPN